MTVTLPEFLAPLKKATVRDQLLAAMFYAGQEDTAATFTVEDIRQLLIRARVPRARTLELSVPLARAGELVDSPGMASGRKLWQLTETGKAQVRARLGLPEVTAEAVNDTLMLAALVTKISDPDIQEYVAESLACLRFGALRASVVFLWVGAVRTLQQAALAHNVAALNAAVQHRDSKARPIRMIDHFAYIKESTFLLAAEDIGLLDKNQRQVLEDALNLRNKCGHPGKYSPGPKKVSAFIEDVLKIVFGVS